MVIAEILLIFILGLIFGSFANVLIDRGEKEENLLGRSHCDHCKYLLRWYDNVPILSFLFLRGKCRKCGKKLSWQYPAVEMAMGLVFLLLAHQAGMFYQELYFEKILEVSFYIFIGFLLVVIFVWDLKYMIIPDGLILSGLIITGAYYLFLYFVSPYHFFSLENIFFSGLLGGLAVGGFFYMLYVFSNGKWIGGGDVKIGFWLGFLVGLQYAYLLLSIAYLSGALVALPLLLSKKKNFKSQIPFGPFLVFAGMVVLLWGQEIIYWYLTLVF